MASSARDTLADVSELVMIILSFIDIRSLARSARVCRRWKEIALDLLWREVDDLHRLMSKLCPFGKPMRKMAGGRTLLSYKYKRRISKQDWERFSPYANRVRRLVFDERSAKYRTKVIDNIAFFDISGTKPDRLGGVLPNLQSLVWHVHNPESQFKAITFMHHTVREFDVQIHPTVHAGKDIDFIWQIGSRMPELTHLTLRLGGPLQQLEDHFCRLFERLPKLQKVVLPRCGSTTSVIEGLSRLTYLREISLGEPDESGIGDTMNTEHFSPILHEGAFPSLRCMSFSALLPAAMQFVDSPGFPANLSRLYVHVTSTVEANILRGFFSMVAKRCAGLVDLVVDFVICPNIALTTPAPPIETRPSISTFRPLFSCRHIASFEFRWDYPLCLQDCDMEEFASAWPRLEYLMLNAEAVIESTPSTLTLGALVPFASRCARLRHLGIYINADAAPSYMIDAPFNALQNLSVGASNITAADPVALFLSQLCSPYCEIMSGFRWPDAYGIALDNAGILDERRTKICEFCVRWNEVMKVLPVVIRARMEERDRVAFRTVQHEAGSPRQMTPVIWEATINGSPQEGT
ncbi:hypothetical protein DAEQUDRAFT_698593 [Daedalea quercina L-15889]|uniref:F-box domain-containing protein n=1 Tax=Daedalea quercina L-15889 TaxID=1314783 RepID=A0A165LK03_9APHY|nr:hypothetical protein DAEQUDRAFT_698593 [Daedalea quercina L-15889]